MENQKRDIRFGIIGAGIIADVLANTIDKVEGAVNYAIASRSEEKALIFKEKYGFAKIYTSYEELAKDEDVDIVYIATPHSYHSEHAKLCLAHGRNVLCEKPFAVNTAQAKEVISLAEEKGLFLSEAMWTRFMPLAKKLKELIDAKVIGEISTITGNLNGPMLETERLINPELAGGALLDIGIYPLTIASIVMGEDIKELYAHAILTDRGVDKIGQYTLIYENGTMADLNSGMCSFSDTNAVIYGDKGYIVVNGVNRLNSLTVCDPSGNVLECYERGEQISGYEFEIQACVEALNSGRTECEEITHEKTIRMMEIMDSIREKMGVKYPFE